MSSGALLGSVRSRVLLTAVVPLVLITAALTWFMLAERTRDLAAALQQLGTTTVSYIAGPAEYGLFTGDSDYLERLAQSALHTPPIVGVSFYNDRRQPLVTAGRIDGARGSSLLPCPELALSRGAERWYFCAPVRSATPEVEDYASAGTAVSTASGWVVLALDTQSMQAQRREMILLSSITAGTVLLIAAAIALRIGGSISRPMRRLTDAVRDLEAGRLDREAPVEGPEEVRFLASGINQLAGAVRESQSNLEQKINHATAKLTDALADLSERNRELEATRDDLQHALTAKDQFLARMSHELRTPLTSVIGFSRLLSHSTVDAQQREYSQNIANASALLLATIDDILDYAKLQANAVALEAIEFDLREQMEDLVAMHAYQAYGKALELVLIIDSDVPPRLVGDPMRLKQVVNNLLSNAIKFTAHGEVVLRISLVSGDSLCPELEFRVRDSGIGMTPEQRSQLFQPFTQADTSITRQFGGSGLGLVICRQLVELMGGSIAIDSEPGNGTDVHFQLSLQRGAAESPVEEKPAELPLLLYDRNPWSRRAVRNQLLQWTGQLFAAGTLDQSWRLLREPPARFGLVVLGLSTEEMAPARLSELLAALRIHYDGPVLLLACISNVQSKVPDDIFSNYAPLYCLSKPARREALRGVLGLIAGDEPAPAEQTRQPVPVKKCLAELNILVAEDNPYNRQLIESLLTLAGATVEAVDNGADVVKRYRSRTFDLVLMDVHMPALDGIAATRAILDSDPGAAVIALTANVIENEERAMREAGAREILYKPLDEARLLDVLCRVAGRPAPDHGAAAATSIFSAGSEAVPALKEELTRLIKSIRHSLDQQDVPASREKLHELLGLSGLFGMHELRLYVKDLHRAVLDNRFEQINQLLARIEAEIVAFRNTPAGAGERPS